MKNISKNIVIIFSQMGTVCSACPVPISLSLLSHPKSSLMPHAMSEHFAPLTRVNWKYLYYEMSQINQAGTDWPLAQCTLPQLLSSSGKCTLMKRRPGLSWDIVTRWTTLSKFHKAHFITGYTSVGVFFERRTLRGLRQRLLKWLHNYTVITENYTLVRHCWKPLISLHFP